MTLCLRHIYRALALIIVVAAIAAGTPLAVRAGMAEGFAVAAPDASARPAGKDAPLLVADASTPGHGDMPISVWPVSLNGEQIRPPAEKDLPGTDAGLASTAIIKPLKDRNLSLAITAGTSGVGDASSLHARPVFFKRALSKPQTVFRNESVQWVVLTGADSMDDKAIRIENDAVDVDSGSWYYSVEMVFVPVASLAVRAALSVDPGADAFNARELDQVFEWSRIGVSIGLDFRPRDGVILDIDYARLIRHRGDFSLSQDVPASRAQDGDGPVSEDDVISVSLSIQF